MSDRKGNTVSDKSGFHREVEIALVMFITHGDSISSRRKQVNMQYRAYKKGYKRHVCLESVLMVKAPSVCATMLVCQHLRWYFHIEEDIKYRENSNGFHFRRENTDFFIYTQQKY